MESPNVSQVTNVQMAHENVLGGKLHSFITKEEVQNLNCYSNQSGRFQHTKPHCSEGPSRRVAIQDVQNIEITLDLGKNRVMDTKLRLYVGEKNVAVQSSPDEKLSGSHGKIVSELDSNVFDKSTVEYMSVASTLHQRVKKVLVRPVENQDLEITAVVMLDAKSGKETRVAVNEVVLCGSPTSAFVIEPPRYTLREHIQDLCSGFLRADFYEKINEQGYDLTIRSFARHFLNNFEAVVGTSDIKLEKQSITNNDVNSSSSNDSKCLSPSFLRNMYVDGAVCISGKAHANWGQMISSTVSAQCQSKVHDDTLLNNQVCRAVRRKLGIDNDFSTAESSTLIGMAAIGMGLSFLYARQRPAVVKNVAGTRLYSVGFSSSNSSVYSSVRKSLKRLL